MLTYDSLVEDLEDAWESAGLHEHEIVEQVQPDTHERSFKAELFADHDSLAEDLMPPWVEVSFTWSAAHQLRSEGHRLPGNDPLDLTWIYNVLVNTTMRDRSDAELVRLFQKGVYMALKKFYPSEVTEMTPVAVEVRRIYHSDGKNLNLEYVQLISPNITDLSDQWNEQDPEVLRNLLQNEIDLAHTVINALSNIFLPPSQPKSGGRNSYRAVDTA
jgi:hypothetical protein